MPLSASRSLPMAGSLSSSPKAARMCLGRMNGTLFLKNRLPPNVHEYRDRHGKLRRYFRKRGHPQIALKGKPGSIEFITAYNAALASLTLPEIGKQRSAPGSLSAAIANYYTHNRFRALAPTTQKMRRA